MRRSIKRFVRLEQLETRETPSITAVGPEFRLNSFTSGSQNSPAIALDADGDFVTAWTSAGEDGSGNGIVARRFNKDGTPLAGSFIVNTFTTGDQFQPAVAANAAGDFVVAWAGNAQDGDGFGIIARRYDAAGNALDSEFVVNEFTTGSQSAPAVALSATGGFVIAWTSLNQIGQSHEMYARRYSAAGVALGGEFRVNSFTIDSQTNPAIGMNSLGDFVIAWHSGLQDGSGAGVYAQAYRRDGTLNGGEFRVNTFTTGTQVGPAVAVGASGAFTIVWQSDNQASPTSSNDIYGQRFGADALPVGSEFPVNSATTGPQTQVAIAADLSGDFAVAFSTNHTGNGDIALRPGSANGTLDTQLTSNTHTTGTQSQPSLAMSANGDLVVVWNGEGTGDTYGIFAQRYDQPVDDVGPFVTGVYVPNRTNGVNEGDVLLIPPASLTVAFAEDVSVTGGSGGANSVTNKNNWRLRLNGTDIASTAISSISYGFNPLARRHEATFNLASPLAQGAFQIEPTAAIQDAAGNSIDGDFDGVPGGAFIRSFRVGSPGPVGPEFRVNTFTTNSQIETSVATDAAGNFVVVWESGGQDGDGSSIHGQRYNAQGSPLGGEFRINTFTTSSQQVPDVAMDQTGNFVVVWHSNGQDGSGIGVYGQRFLANGNATGSEFRINNQTVSNQRLPSVTMTPAGSFVVAWDSFGTDGVTLGIVARRFASNGNPIGNEFLVNTFATGDQSTPDVAVDAAGNFVVTWQSNGQDGGGQGVYCRRFNASGVALDAADVLVNESTIGDQMEPAIAAGADGSFIVAWDNNSGSLFGINARRFDAAGAPLTSELRVNTNTTSGGERPAVALDASGVAVVIWDGQSDQTDVFFRRMDPLGSFLGDETRVNTETTQSQFEPAVAAQPAGGFVAVWRSFDQDGSSNGIYGQRFALPLPRIPSVQVHDGAAQRSRITSLTVNFDGIVTFAGSVGGAFTLTRNGGGPVGFTATASIVNNATVVTLNVFTGTQVEFDGLRDGRYTLSVFADQISGAGGQLDGDGDGIGGDNFTFGDAQGLFRFYADMTGDRRVDISDFGFFSLAYLTPANFSAALDFNNDGRIDIADFGQFSVRYFTTLP